MVEEMISNLRQCSITKSESWTKRNKFFLKRNNRFTTNE